MDFGLLYVILGSPLVKIKGTILVSDVDDGGNYIYIGVGDIWEIT